MKTYYGRTGFMEDLLKKNPKMVFDQAEGIKEKRTATAINGGKTSLNFMRGLEGAEGYEKSRAKTLEMMRHIVKDASYTLVFEHDHYSMTKTQCGMTNSVSSPLKVSDTVTKQLLVNTFQGIAVLFGFWEPNHKLKLKWKEVDGYRVDLAFGDMDLCVEIGGPKYHASEVTWAQVEKTDYVMALVATTVASVENILDNYIDHMINCTKAHFEKNA